ncbi:MAG: hypothetical protein DRJ38_06195 [Thermoprotei archaeon]|nr:MAG: hypothetical protein DRJ38_06195 [Thermoprotei archaeon]
MRKPIYIHTPKLKIARLFAAGLILAKAEKADLLALPYPKEMKNELEKFTRNLLSWNQLQKRIIELMGSYGYSWLNIEEPLFLGLRLIRERNPRLKLFLYGSISEEDEKYRLISDLLALALKCKLKGRIEVREWRQILNRYHRSQIEIKDKKAIIVVEDRSQIPRDSILVEALPGYVESPIERLFSLQISEQVIKDYIEYVTEYLVRYSTIDYAYFKWVKDRGFRGLIARLSDSFINMLSINEY